MRRTDLANLQRPVIEVKHGEHTYHVHPPSWADYMSIQRSVGAMAKSTDEEKGEAYIELITLAVMATLKFDDDPEPCTREEAETVIFNTGLHASPVAEAALEQCGINKGGDDEGGEDETDLPF